MPQNEESAESKIPDFVLEQELDEIQSMCRECGKVHGSEACQYDEEDGSEFAEEMVGCGYQGYEFGARYPDSICVDGYLWDADACDSVGRLYKPNEEIPCPMCREAEAVQYWTERNMLASGLPRKQARVIAKGLVKSIRGNRENGTEPWKSEQSR